MTSEKISVIIPAYNQASRLEVTLQSLCYQRLPTMLDFEIILIDDGSDDQTSLTGQQFLSRLPLTLHVQSNLGRAAARNAGIKISMGNILLFTDADRPVCQQWINNHWQFHQQHPQSVGIGDIHEFYFARFEQRQNAIMESLKDNFASLLHFARAYKYWEFVKQSLSAEGRCLLSSPWVMTLTGNLSVPRSLLTSAGNFDESFNSWGFEHFELGYRLQQAGASFWYVPDAANYHLAHPRPIHFYEEQMEKSFSYFMNKHPVPAVQELWALLHGMVSLEQFDFITRQSLPSPLPITTSKLYYHSRLE